MEATEKILQRMLVKLKNPLNKYDQLKLYNQTAAGPGRIEKQVQRNHYKLLCLTNFCDAFECLRLEHEQILLDLFWACHKLRSDIIQFQRGKAGKASRTSFQDCNAAEQAKKSQ